MAISHVPRKRNTYSLSAASTKAKRKHALPSDKSHVDVASGAYIRSMSTLRRTGRGRPVTSDNCPRNSFYKSIAGPARTGGMGETGSIVQGWKQSGIRQPSRKFQDQRLDAAASSPEHTMPQLVPSNTNTQLPIWMLETLKSHRGVKRKSAALTAFDDEREENHFRPVANRFWEYSNGADQHFRMQTPMKSLSSNIGARPGGQDRVRNCLSQDDTMRLDRQFTRCASAQRDNPMVSNFATPHSVQNGHVHTRPFAGAARFDYPASPSPLQSRSGYLPKRDDPYMTPNSNNVFKAPGPNYACDGRQTYQYIPSRCTPSPSPFRQSYLRLPFSLPFRSSESFLTYARDPAPAIYQPSMSTIEEESCHGEGLTYSTPYMTLADTEATAYGYAYPDHNDTYPPEPDHSVTLFQEDLEPENTRMWATRNEPSLIPSQSTASHDENRFPSQDSVFSLPAPKAGLGIDIDMLEAAAISPSTGIEDLKTLTLDHIPPQFLEEADDPAHIPPPACMDVPSGQLSLQLPEQFVFPVSQQSNRPSNFRPKPKKRHVQPIPFLARDDPPLQAVKHLPDFELASQITPYRNVAVESATQEETESIGSFGDEVIQSAHTDTATATVDPDARESCLPATQQSNIGYPGFEVWHDDNI